MESESIRDRREKQIRDWQRDRRVFERWKKSEDLVFIYFLLVMAVPVVALFFLVVFR